MAIESGDSDIHWNYFLAIEEDLVRLSRFIEFHEDNYLAYSLECARILLAASAEVDVLKKQIRSRLNPSAKKDKDEAIRRAILSKYPNLYRHEIKLPKYGLLLKPWINWEHVKTPPEWWDAYNNVKHHRHELFRHSNLKNTLNAVSRLVCDVYVLL
jgi:hypothetical protein